MSIVKGSVGTSNLTLHNTFVTTLLSDKRICQVVGIKCTQSSNTYTCVYIFANHGTEHENYLFKVITECISGTHLPSYQRKGKEESFQNESELKTFHDMGEGKRFCDVHHHQRNFYIT